MRNAFGTFVVVVAVVLCLFGWLADETWKARGRAIMRIQHQYAQDVQQRH
jgi:nitrate reductase assembly molybdenum cofactor insertion protein NarJ